MGLINNKKEVPIMEGEVGYNVDYRLPGDGAHFIRVKQVEPVNLKKISQRVMLLGITNNLDNRYLIYCAF